MSDASGGDDKGKPRLKIAEGKESPRWWARVREFYAVDPLDKEIIKILYEHPTASYREISGLLGVTTRQVEKRVRKPGVMKRLSDARMDVDELVKKGQEIGLKKLIGLSGSKDEFIALQASKLLSAPALASAMVRGGGLPPSGVVYEVQVGPQGQVYQTVRALADPGANPNRFPTPSQALARIVEAEAKVVEQQEEPSA